jgi:exosortase
MTDPQKGSSIDASGEEGFSPELRAFWRHWPDKGFFFVLFVAWLALFHLIGNSTFGYVSSASLFNWMAKIYYASGSEEAFANFIPLLVLGLMWVKRKELLSQPLKTWWPGLWLIMAGLFLHVFGYLLQQTRLSIVGFFIGLYGLMGLTWGPAFLRATFFPFFLFGFMVPLSTIATPVTFRLQVLVTKIVSFLCHDVLGFSVVRNGTQLVNSVGGYQYEVAAACGGIRSLASIGLLSIVYAFLVFPALWQRLLLMACAFPFAVLGNTVRLMVIVVSAEAGGQSAGVAAHNSGFWSMIPYVPAIIGFALVGRWMENRTSAKSDRINSMRRQPAPL